MRTEKFLVVLVLTIILMLSQKANIAFAKTGYNYQLYKNYEDFGILIFPKSQSFTELEMYIKQAGFSSVESGKAVMRFGLKNENQTFMMPQSVQKKYSIDRFIILQVLSNQNIVVGIFDPEWGLTLPSPIHKLDEIKNNIPKTLNLFRKQLKKREATKETIENFKRIGLSTQNPASIIKTTEPY